MIRHRIIIAVALILSAFAQRATALECDPAKLCPTSPCTITGTHQLENDCTLDFTGMDVTIAPNAALIWPHDGSQAEIDAANLTVSGSLEALDTALIIAVTGNLTSKRFPGSGNLHTRGSVISPGSGIVIAADGDVTLSGSLVEVDGTEPFLWISGANIQINSRTVLTSPSPYGTTQVDIEAYPGSLTTTRPITTSGEGGYIVMYAGGDIAIGDKMRVSGTDGISQILISADGDVAIDAPLACRTGGDFEVTGAQKIAIHSDVIVTTGRSTGENAQAIVTPAPGGSVEITGKIKAFGEVATGIGEITIGPACSVALSGELLARKGTTTVQYSDSFDATGGRLVATASQGGNQILCRCIDNNNDGTCDGGCAIPPVGLNQAVTSPKPVVEPVPMSACGS